MNGFGEIPKYIRFDFLITFLGLLLIGSGWYFSNVIKINPNSTGSLFILGIPITIWGMGEMYNNYKEGRDLKQLQVILEKTEIFCKLQNKKILDADKKKFFAESLKKEIDDVIEKKKELTIT